MEAAPRLQMLCFEQKLSSKVSDFSHPFKKFIATFYNEDPNKYSKAIFDLEQLRTAACKASKDFQGIQTLRRYYSQLRLQQNRFPMTDDGAACVAFMWSDLYSGVMFNIADVKYELSSILYNIGALHSQLGAIEDRTSAEGMKNACTHFQAAAWAFQHNRDTYPQPKGCDLSHDLLTFYSLVMLAQSQECILEKSMLDNRKSGISAKIASQIVDFYTKSINNLSSDVKSIVGSKIFQQWKRICEMKASYYGALTALYMGMTAEEDNQYGLRVAWYKLAMERFEESLRAAEDLGIEETLAFTRDVIGGKLNVGVRENDFVYHDKVPNADSLPEVKGAVLVKGTPFDPNDPEVCGPDLFATLIPMAAHEASSVYSEQKAQLLRRLSKVIEDKNADLASYESSLNISKKDLFEMMKKPVLPPDIIEVCAQFSTNRLSISAINSQLAQIDAMSDEVGRYLSEAEQLIAMSNPASVTSNVVADLRAELNKYKEIRTHSANNNETLREALEAHDDHLALLQLAPETLEQKLPHVISATKEDEKVILEFIKLLDKLEEMKQQRERLFSELRDALINDDITKLIVANAQEDLNEVFERALAKHKLAIAVLEKNLLAQDNILKAVSQANANTAEIRMNLEQARRPWTTSIENLRAAYKSFEEVERQATKGTDFYGIFVNDVRRLATRLRSVVQVEKEQEEKLRARQAELARPPVFKPESNPAFVSRPPNIPPTAQAQNAQPPKLKDYLAMMNNAKKNEYVPRAMPGSTGISQSPMRPSVAMSSMGESTSLTGNTQPPQMSLPAPGSAMPPQTPSPAVLPPGARIVPEASNPTQSPAASSNDAKHPRSSLNVVVPGARPSPSSPAAAQSNQGYSAYNVESLGGYGQPAYQGYAPYAHLYSANTTSSNAAPRPSNDPNSSSNAQPIQTSVNAYSYAQSPQQQQQQQYQTGYQYGHAGVPGALGNPNAPLERNMPSAGVAAPAPDSATSNISTAVQNHPMSQAQYYGNTQGGVAGCLTNVYKWNGYDFPTASPTASASFVMTSGMFNSTVTSSNTLHKSQNPYAQCQQMGTTQQYQGYAVSSQASSVPGGATSYVYPTSASTAVSVVSTSSMGTVSTAAIQAQGPNSRLSAPNALPAAPNNTLPTSATIGGGTYNAAPNVAFQAHATPIQGPVAPNSNPPLQYLPASTCGSVPNNTYSVASMGVAPMPGQNFPTTSASTVPAAVNPTSQTGQGAKSLLDESPALPMPSEGQIIQDILQPVVLPIAAAKSAEYGTLNAETPKEPEDRKPETSASLSTKTADANEKSTEGICDSKPERSLDDPRTLQNFRNLFDQLDDYTRTFNLENRWKEFLDLQETEARALKISVGRICSMKNRFPDIMPYDYNRVVLSTTKDDYINASFLKSTPSTNEPNCILTQAPIPSTLEDFWAMVWEQSAETMLSLSSFQELSSQLFFPSEKGTTQSYGHYQVSVQSYTEKECGLFTERLLSVSGPQGPAKNLILLHLNEWTRDVSKLALFGKQVLYYYNSQKRKESPVIIQCLGGCGRSGLIAFCLKWLSNLEEARLLPITSLLADLVRGRKLVLLEKDQLKTCVELAHFTTRSLLVERGCIEQISEKSTEMEEIHYKEKNGEKLTVEERLIQDLMAGFQVKTKITKESFEKPRGLESSAGDPSDPLSQLDPLWSLKK
ncbi:tyrosine-protein phosphatase non-receptor type 23 [Galendromus occidentalis]|uniref:Tyrosine-protein phosphatase non-receptor type 23 n=1 Tax=Galendromus occidentalis TaxID=34638 RepID=A0AAJ6QR23_9ACAR|nr:tyrosine-protein phosphatase non-receptor type 23 [Galendromus occidentalis]